MAFSLTGTTGWAVSSLHSPQCSASLQVGTRAPTSVVTQLFDDLAKSLNLNFFNCKNNEVRLNIC